MITVRPGTAFWNDPADIRVNTVNCVGVMGTGIAAQFRVRFPGLLEQYQRTCRSGQLWPGTLLTWGTDPVVVCFPTKDHWADPSLYRYVHDGLEALRTWLNKQPAPKIVAIPPLGCTNGGLHWPIVRMMVEGALEKSQHTIHLYAPIPRMLNWRGLQ